MERSEGDERAQTVSVGGDRNQLLRWAVALLLLALIVTGAWGYGQYRGRQLALNYLEGERQRAFYNLLYNVENMELSLAKCMAAGSPSQMQLHLAQASRYAESAISDLGGIPMGHTTLLRTGTFLNQTGDYALSLARTVSEGRALTESEQQQLGGLHQQATELGQALHDLRDRLGEVGHRWSTLQLLGEHSYDAIEMDDGLSGLAGIEKHLTQYPTLIYDGPFSDHVFDFAPRGLTGAHVTEERARNRAREILADMGEEDAEVEKVSEVRGTIPAYTFTAAVAGKQYWLDISRKGGHLVWLNTGAEPGEPAISLEEARDVAIAFAEEAGYSQLRPLFTQREGDRAVTNFAAEQDGVILYPDQVKVLVSLHDGAVLGLDASSYLMAHTERSLARPEIDEEEALDRVNPALVPGETALALIPRDSLEEVLCWEIRGTVGESEFIVYVNAHTGVEEQIFQLIPVEGGYLTQ
ncbi:MAG: germination protein YpeB [Bacillota bacterium]